MVIFNNFHKSFTEMFFHDILSQSFHFNKQYKKIVPATGSGWGGAWETEDIGGAKVTVVLGIVKQRNRMKYQVLSDSTVDTVFAFTQTTLFHSLLPHMIALDHYQVGPYGMQWVEARSAACKANAIPGVKSLGPQ